MTLPDKHLFSTAEVMQQLSMSQSTMRRLIDSGQLVAVYPSKPNMRVTRESLVALLELGSQRGAVAASMVQGEQSKAQVIAQAQVAKKDKRMVDLMDRWGLGGIFGKVKV